MVKRIALFNHKGGVSKTTTTFNLGWRLAQMGNRVILVDADPQSNLTGLVLGYRSASEFEDFYANRATQNFKSGLQSALEQFHTNLSRVRNLGSIVATLESQTLHPLDLSDILRAELVLSVSALDHYVHEVVRMGMLEAYRGGRNGHHSFLLSRCL